MARFVDTFLPGDLEVGVKYTTNKGYVEGSAFRDEVGRKFRWSKIAVAAYKMGQQVRGATANALNLPTGFFAAVQSAGCYGNAVGDTQITLYSAASISDASAYQNGKIIIQSGGGAGHMYPVGFYETGTASKRSKLFLKKPLAAKLTTSTNAYLVPNPYYNAVLAGTMHASASLKSPLGVLTASGTASGWQLIQTAGEGVGHAKGAVASGQSVGPGVSGCFSATMAVTSTACIRTGRAVTPGAAGKKFCVDILIESL